VDLLVANLVGADHTGFGSETNEAAILEPGGGGVPMRRWTKRELAVAIWDRVVERLQAPDAS
jgi:phosphopantothenoylcysteine synthetase/decarboxylase